MIIVLLQVSRILSGGCQIKYNLPLVGMKNISIWFDFSSLLFAHFRPRKEEESTRAVLANYRAGSLHNELGGGIAVSHLEPR